MKKLLTTISTITLSVALLFTSITPILASEVNLSSPLSSSSSNTISQNALTKTVKPTKVTLDSKTLQLNVGDNETLIPTIFPSTATNQNVTWKSNNIKIATVDSDGTVSGIKKGRVIITATTVDGKKTAKCVVTVKTAPIINVTGINLDEENISMNVGDSDILTVTITPDNATNQNITWSSSDESIVTVNSEGEIEGISSGDVTITATTKDGNKKATCEITVVTVEDDIPIVNVESVSLDRKIISMKVGENETLTATINPNDATNKNLIWDSNNESVLTVDQSGRIAAVSSGSSDITATSIDGNKTDICKVTVENVEIPLTISSISDIQQTINQNDSYYPPSTVEALMSDNTKKQVGITWNIPNLSSLSSTSIINENDLTDDFNNESLTKSNSVFNVKEKEKMENKIKEEKLDFDNSLDLDVNETRTQLSSILATIDTSKAGIFTFYGKVNGYDKQVKLTLTIKAVSSVRFFPLLSDVPMPVGYDYKKVSVSSSGTVFYYYDMNAFSFLTFSESIKPYGWTYYDSDVDYQGYSIFYFRKGNSLIGMAWIGYDRVIYGKIR
ncbi:MAG TPA: hypothetical protein DEG71_10185 [Clostridiales bacterium]|nr:hypothetical protein [Clostridiales bacterium]